MPHDTDLSPLEVGITCSGLVCVTQRVGSIPPQTIRVEDLTGAEGGTSKSVLTKHEITLLQYAGANLVSYGAWLDHSGFAVQQLGTLEVEDAGEWSVYYGVAGGERTRDLPETGIEARWDGLLVGAIGHRDGGDAVQGDTVLRWHDAGSGQQLDIAFSNIQNLTRGRAHGQDYALERLTLDTNGSFAKQSDGNHVQGAFYGPNHAEAAGTVELGNPTTAGIVGAFGAKRAP